MARFKDVHYDQDKFIPVSFHKKLGQIYLTLHLRFADLLNLSMRENRYVTDGQNGLPD